MAARQAPGASKGLAAGPHLVSVGKVEGSEGECLLATREQASNERHPVSAFLAQLLRAMRGAEQQEGDAKGAERGRRTRGI